MSYPSHGFLLIITNCSARCIRKRVNLCVRISSISSACLIQMLTLTELIDGSISVRSFSFREIVIGWSSSSRLVLGTRGLRNKVTKQQVEQTTPRTSFRLLVCCVSPQLGKESSSGTKPQSTSNGYNPSRVSRYSPRKQILKLLETSFHISSTQVSHSLFPVFYGQAPTPRGIKPISTPTTLGTSSSSSSPNEDLFLRETHERAKPSASEIFQSTSGLLGARANTTGVGRRAPREHVEGRTMALTAQQRYSYGRP